MYQKSYTRHIISTFIVLALLVFISFLLSSCKKTEEDPDPAYVAPVTKFSGQNQTPVVGVGFGSGAESNSTLYKTVPIALKGASHVDLKITKAYIQKPDILGALRISYVIPIDNISTNHAYCNVRSSGLTFLGSDYGKIYTDAIDSKAYASIGLSNSTDWEHCINPGGTGFIVGTTETLALDPFSKVQFVEVGLSVGSDSVINSGAKIEAASYVVNGEFLDISVKNNGYDTAYVWPYTSIVLVVDQDDVVMQWNYVNAALQLPTQMPSTVGLLDTLPILKSKITFAGTAYRAIFLFTFSTSSFYPF